MASMSIFIALSLSYSFVAVVLIALYAHKEQNNSLFSSIFSAKHYRIYFAILFVCSLVVLMWQGINAIYVILMFLLLLGIIDIKCLALPDTLNFSLLLVCVVYAFLESIFLQESFIYRVLLGFGVGGIFFTLKILYQSLTNKDILGEADIIVLSSLGIAFGAPSAFVSVFLGSIAALVYALFLNLIFKRTLFELKLPFCFFIFIGVILHFVWFEYGERFYA